MQFHIHKHEISARWYGNKNWVGLIMYVKQGATWKHIQKLETITNESICSKFTIAMTKWLYFIIYRHLTPENFKLFFEKLTNFFFYIFSSIQFVALFLIALDN